MTTLKSKLIDEVESLSKELIELTRDLVKIPSENPPGDEVGVSEKVGGELRALGFEVEFVEPAPRYPSATWNSGPWIPTREW
jgi:succinyl-diaminopimelate desuccinylase